MLKFFTHPVNLAWLLFAMFCLAPSLGHSGERSTKSTTELGRSGGVTNRLPNTTENTAKASDSLLDYLATDINPKEAQRSGSQAQSKKKVKYKGRYRIKGKEYRILASADGFKEVGMASWYGPGFHGKKTANGEIFNMNAMTAAHRNLPLGTRVKVTNLKNKRVIIVRINDRGPFHNGRIIDLSKKAASQLGLISSGKGLVKVEVSASR